jgi:M6 family metalloprotease-like protein
VQAAQQAQRRLANLPPGVAAAAPVTGTAVSGTVEVPVILVTFANTAAEPYPAGNLKKQLFDGPWPSGTMSEHYREMSRGKLEVKGEVVPWIKLSQDDRLYAGPAGCNGLCNAARLGEMLTEALRTADTSIDFRRFDNDGPDNVPNSADDDGFVDFVAFVHPESGGECSNDNIWSHRYSLLSLTGGNYQTGDVGHFGTNVLIDDYVVMPGLACDETTMIPIGVFSHEFGHAFGLPDLYDTQRPPQSSGIGAWGLMGSGSWGGDGQSTPHLPTHMETWSKEFLGWVTPKTIISDQRNVQLRPVESSGDVVRIDYPESADPEDKRYLLLEYRSAQGFDRSIPVSGLLVTEINNARVEGGLINNSVNNVPFDMGVNVIEADGLRNLDRMGNRSDAGDLFPGQKNITSLDVTHAETIPAALCNIVQTPSQITLDVFVNQTTCPGNLAPAAVAPAAVAQQQVLPGQEVVVQGILTNKGTNFFTDRRLVISGENGAGGELTVSAPVPLTTSPQPSAAAAPADQPTNLSDLLNKKVFLRGEIQRQMQKGQGPTDVLVVKEFKLAQ